MDELIAIMRVKIREYVEEKGIRLEQLAREIDVPLVQLHDIARGKASRSLANISFAILSKVAPNEAIPLLRKYQPYSFDMFAGRYSASGRGKLDSATQIKTLDGDIDITRLVFKSVLHYHIYGWILATRKAESIFDMFGSEGSQVLDEFLENGILYCDEKGEVHPTRNYTVVMTDEHFARQAILNIESLNLSSKYHLINNDLVPLNDECVLRIRELIRETNIKISEIFRNPANHGPIPVVYTVALSSLQASLNLDSFDRIVTHAAGLAHDMRAPLRHISNYLERQEALGDNAALARAKAATLRVDHMIDALRKMESEEIVSKQMDILRMEPLLDFAECLAYDFRIKFSFSGPLIVRGILDVEKVDRAIQNLLSNAFEAARSEVHFEWYDDGHSWVVRVVDDGVGIPESVVDRIYDRGFTSGKPQGTGLGLSQVKSLADGHDGSIRGERVNDTTVFTLVLRNVFVSVLVADNTSDRSLAVGEKPILFLEATDAELQANLFEAIGLLIPEYRVTSDKDLLAVSKVACTDSLDIALLASNIGASRVWNPSLESMRNLRFAEALRQLAVNELANMT